MCVVEAVSFMVCCIQVLDTSVPMIPLSNLWGKVHFCVSYLVVYIRFKDFLTAL